MARSVQGLRNGVGRKGFSLDADGWRFSLNTDGWRRVRALLSSDAHNSLGRAPRRFNFEGLGFSLVEAVWRVL